MYAANPNEQLSFAGVLVPRKSAVKTADALSIPTLMSVVPPEAEVEAVPNTLPKTASSPQLRKLTRAAVLSST